MNIKNIQDQIENYALGVAVEAYKLGMNDTQQLYSKDVPMPRFEDTRDKLLEIVKSKLEDK